MALVMVTCVFAVAMTVSHPVGSVHVSVCLKEGPGSIFLGVTQRSEGSQSLHTHPPLLTLLLFHLLPLLTGTDKTIELHSICPPLHPSWDTDLNSSSKCISMIITYNPDNLVAIRKYFLSSVTTSSESAGPYECRPLFPYYGTYLINKNIIN